MLTFFPLDQPLIAGWRRGRFIQRFMRTRNAKLPVSLFVVTGAVRELGWDDLALGAFLLVMVYGFVVILNDINDVEGDRLNNRDLPLAQGEISMSEASRILAGLAVMITFLVLVWGNTAGAATTAAATAAGYGYSDPRLRISDRGFLGPVLLALCYVVTPILFALGLTGGSLREGLPVIVIAILFAFATSLYKDYGDELGDAAVGKLTPVIRYGPGRVGRLAITAQGVAIGLGLVLVGASWWLLPALAGLGASMSMNSNRPTTLMVAHRYLTTASVCLLAAAVLG